MFLLTWRNISSKASLTTVFKKFALFQVETLSFTMSGDHYEGYTERFGTNFMIVPDDGGVDPSEFTNVIQIRNQGIRA